MFKQAEVLDAKRHAEFGFVPVDGHAFARGVTSAPLSYSEMRPASLELPIVFSAAGKLLPVAQLGFQKDENLLVSPEGSWRGDYVPAHLRRYPFILGDKGESGKFAVMVDETALVAKTEGEPLFDEAGNPPAGGIVERARNLLVKFQRELNATEAFLKPLEDHGVLVERAITIRRDDTVIGRLTGLRMIDEEKLKALDDATLAAWARSGLLGVVHAHLHSQRNWDRIVKHARTDASAPTH